MTEQKEAATSGYCQLLEEAVRASRDAWVDWSEDGIRWAGYVTEGHEVWVSPAVADAVAHALTDGSKGES